jgi:predicted outer membrane repeat protein
MDISVLLHQVNVTENDLPFIEFEDKHTVSVTVTGLCVFHKNRNFILHLVDGLIHFVGARVNFTNCTTENAIAQSAPIYTQGSVIEFEDSTILFYHNQGSLCGGIVADATQIYFKSNVTLIFYNNSGLNGGALSLYSESRLHFNASSFSNISLYFNNNIAQLGGAIYVDDSRYKNIESIIQLHCDPENVRLTFGNNNVGGNQIYGGWIDWFMNETTGIPGNEMDMVNTILIKFETQNYTQDLVSSHPIRNCLCINNYIDCNITDYNMTIYGKALTLELVGVGQRYTPIISYVEANLRKSDIHPRLTILLSACTKINYYVIKSQNEEMLSLKPYLSYLYSDFSHYEAEGIVDDLFKQLTIRLRINECPWGFEEQSNGSCQCQLLNLGLHCDMNNFIIIRDAQQWVGATYEHNLGKSNPGVIAHQHCPFDYCRSDNESLSISLENQDEQCAFNREGILCGGCRENLSRVLGTSNCSECTNRYTALIAVGWLISGFILVTCLMLLNLTISVGTINGLTFYANIIRAQHTTFFTPDISNSFLSKFIAWLNLDIGTEMCLYDGLDSYVITWLQYVYPLYIWLIAAIIITLSHFSSRISKLCGKNAVQVLATLFLISYARLLRLMIEVFSFTWITYPDGYKKAVWLVDGNYEFFKGKLIPLVLVTIIFVLLSLPYTFTLLTIQFLQKMSHYPVLFWVHRLKPFFDAYTGPYKSRHRYWTGLLLVARLILLIIFSVNQSNNLSINLLAIITVSVVLLGWLSSANWVYTSPLNNFLEITFLGNLILTSAAALFNVSNGRSSPVAIYLSTSIAFALLTFIIFYHIYQRLVLTKLGSKLTVKIMRAVELPFRSVNINSNDTGNTVELSGAGRNKVSSTMVGLDHDSYNSHELKEPLLDDGK